MWQYKHTDELYHWGVIGMKWGRRKGKATSGSSSKSSRKSRMSADALEAKAIKKKKVSEMSNAELRKLNERQNLEKNHKSLNPSVISKGAKIAAATAATLGTIVALESSGKHVISSGKKAVQKVTEGFLRNPTGNRIASKTISILANIKK